MTDREVDIEFFIEEIKKYPVIWNVGDENYHDRTKKRAAWSNICSIFHENFDQKDDRERNEICNKLIKKWRNIRDSYFKSLKKKTKSGQAADNTKKYIYARQLSFLGSSGATTETQSSLTDSHQEDEVLDQPENETEQTAQLKGSERPKYDQGKAMKRKRNVESALIDFMTKPTPISASELDPDRSFFESLLPSIRGFDEDRKIEFRCEVLKLVKRMRNISAIHQPNILSHTNQIAHSNYPQYSSQSSNNLQHSQSYALPFQSTSTNYSYNHLFQPSSHFGQTPASSRVLPPMSSPRLTELHPVASCASSSVSEFGSITSPTDSMSTNHDTDETYDLFQET